MLTVSNYPAKAGIMAMGVASALVLASCADTAGGGTGGGGGGASVEYGATKQQYQEAFADVEPIKLTTQTPSPKGSVTGKPMEDYFKAITEWSGGKITFDVSYSNALVPVEEADDGLLDGRLDIASVLPIYEPSEYPANAELIEATLASDQSAVAGTLQSNAWPNEVAFETPEIVNEFTDNGMKMLLPQYNSGANVLFCSKPRQQLSELNGMQSASGGEAQSAVIEALGGTAASVAYPELYESLQRGVVDCTVSSLTVGVLGGFIDAAPHITVDPKAGFAYAPGAMAFSQATWDSLPLAAQQLFWDRLDVFMISNVEGKIWPNIADAVSQAKKAGGSVKPFGPDAEEAVNETNAKLLDALRGSQHVADPNAFVDRIQQSADKWLKTVEELGISGDVPYSKFDEWYQDGKIDVDAYMKKMYEEILLEHRPS